MNLKKLFNKNLIKKDLKLVYWLIAVATIGLFIDLPMRNISYLSELGLNSPSALSRGEYTKEILRILDRQSGVQIAMCFFMTLGLGITLIGEEKRKGTLDILWQMPYSRGQLYFNKIIVGFISLFIPIFINLFIMFVMSIGSTKINGIYTLSQLFENLFLNMYISMLFFSLAMCIGAITANSISQAIFYVISTVFPIGFIGLIYENIRIILDRVVLIPEVLRNIIEYMSLLMYLFPLYTIGYEEKYLKIYTFIGLYTIIFMILGYILFIRTNIDRNREVLGFRQLNKVLIYASTFFSALILGVVVSLIIDIGKIGLILGYVFGACGGYKLSKYSINVGESK